VADRVLEWSDTQVYAYLGLPETEEIRTRDGQPRSLHAPLELVEPIKNYKLAELSLLQEDVTVIDFGQSYAIAHPLKDYLPGTIINYQLPELRFEGRVGIEADVWALGCAIFEICAGLPLFDSFLGSDMDILRQTVKTLGRLPDSWWNSFKNCSLCFEENECPKSAQDQKLASILLRSSTSPIRAKLCSIGTEDDLPPTNEGSMIEMPGTTLQEEEVKLLENLLDRMLKYYLEERAGLQEIIKHPWFMM
jgi:serine/threonine-protein kinase SRPK3